MGFLVFGRWRDCSFSCFGKTARDATAECCTFAVIWTNYSSVSLPSFSFSQHCQIKWQSKTTIIQTLNGEKNGSILGNKITHACTLLPLLLNTACLRFLKLQIKKPCFFKVMTEVRIILKLPMKITKNLEHIKAIVGKNIAVKIQTSSFIRPKYPA